MKVQLDQINENKDKLTPFNFYKKKLNKKKIIFHNYFVEEIKNHKYGLVLCCSNGYQKKVL